MRKHLMSIVKQIKKTISLDRSLDPEDPPEKGMQPAPVFLPGEFHGQTMGSQESNTTEQPTLHFSDTK